jgi:hypothetical protein
MAPPYSILAEERGFHSLAFLGDEVPDAPTVNGIIASDRKIRARPGEVLRVTRAMLNSVRLYRKRKELAVPFLASEFNLDARAATRVYADAVSVLTAEGEISLNKVRDVLNLAKEAGQPSPAIDKPESLVDFSFVREARRTLDTR